MSLLASGCDGVGCDGDDDDHIGSSLHSCMLKVHACGCVWIYAYIKLKPVTSGNVLIKAALDWQQAMIDHMACHK